MAILVIFTDAKFSIVAVCSKRKGLSEQSAVMILRYVPPCSFAAKLQANSHKSHVLCSLMATVDKAPFFVGIEFLSPFLGY